MRRSLRPKFKKLLLAGLIGGAAAFTPAVLFGSSEPGFHAETYDPASLLTRRNQLTYSEFPSGTSNLTGVGTLVTSSALTGYDGAVAVGYDGVSSQSAYKTPGSGWAGASGTISVVVKMDDAGVPAFGSATPSNAANDFVLVLGNTVPSPLTYSVTDLGGGFYRVSGTATIGTSSNSFGVIKYSNNSNRTFKTTAWHFEPYVTSITYQKVTDWNTEYMAAALNSIAMWQDVNGTPVTAVEQVVGMWVDTKMGTAVGPERYTTATAAGAIAYGAGTIVVNGDDSITCTSNAAGGYGVHLPNLAAVVGASYRVRVQIVSNAQGRSVLCTYGGISGNISNVATVKAPQFNNVITVTAPVFYINGLAAGETFTVKFLNVYSVPGNHATQATSASRLTLSARYNQFTKSEQFDDVAWTKEECAVTSGGLVTLSANVGALTRRVRAASAPTMGTTPINQVWRVKMGTHRYVQTYVVNDADAYVNFDLQAATYSIGGLRAAFVTASITAASDAAGYYDLTFSYTSGSGTAVYGYLGFIDDMLALRAATSTSTGTTLYLARADLRTTSDAALNQPAYQRVNTSTDYDTTGFIHYLRLDGTDDRLRTPLIDMSGCGAVDVWVGATKLSDATAGILLEFGPGAADNGSFALFAPISAAAASCTSRMRGTAGADATAAGIPAPASRVLVARGVIATDTNTLRANGAQVAASVGDLGAGNFGNLALNIGARNDTATAPFNGRITSITVRGTTTPTSEAFIKKMEQYAARLAGQSFTSA